VDRRSYTVVTCTHRTRIGPRRRVSSSALLDGKNSSVGAPLPPKEASHSTEGWKFRADSCRGINLEALTLMFECCFPWSGRGCTGERRESQSAARGAEVTVCGTLSKTIRCSIIE
jgi:hypothetical protein